MHDSLYMCAFNIVLAPPIYLVSGAREAREIIIGTAIAAGLGLVQGPWLGYAVDVGRDLTGLGRCERRTYPDLIRRRNPKIKKGLAATLVAASIGLMGGIYSLTPDKIEWWENTPPKISKIEQQTLASNGLGDLETTIIGSE